MNIDNVIENTKLKAKSFTEAILPIIEQYLLVKVKIDQLNDKVIRSDEQVGALMGVLNFCEQEIINEIRNIKIEINEVDKTN